MKNQIPQVNGTLNINRSETIASFIPERNKFKSKTEICQTPIASNELFVEYHNDDNLQFPIKPNQFLTPKNSLINGKGIGLKNQFFSPVWSYYDSSQQYLQKCLKANSGVKNKSSIDYENSSNYKRKDSFCSKPSTTDDLFANDNLILDNMEDIEPLEAQIEKNTIHDNQMNHTEDYFGEPFPDSIGSMGIGKSNCHTPDQYPKAFNYQHPNHQIQNPNKKKNFGTPPFATVQSLNYFNSSHQNRDNQYQYTTEMFGRMGWICVLCNNFNYDTRNKCNRCKNNKSPKILRSLFPSIPPEDIMIHHNAYQNNSTSTAIPIKHHIISNTCNCNRKNPSGNTGVVNNMNIISIVNNQNINLYDTYNQQTDNDYTFNNNNNNNNNNTNINTNTNINPNSSKGINININNVPHSFTNKKKSKPFAERVGDWVCNNCKNLNFSFRNICNRCQMTKTEGGTTDSSN